MSERRKIEEKIRRKEQEIEELEEKVGDARIYIQALQDVLKMFPRDSSAAAGAPELRTGSAVAQARDAILKAGRPLHVEDLLRSIGREPTREARISLSGSLHAYVRKSEIFARPAPNTFGLIELGHTSSTADSPPEGFGDDRSVADDEDPIF